MSGLGLPMPPGGTGGPAMGAPPPKPAGVGPVTLPSANSGNRVKADAAIKQAAELLQAALPNLPMGSEEHTELFTIAKKLSAMVGDSHADKSDQVQLLAKMAHQQAQGAGVPGLKGVMPAMVPPAPPGGGADMAA